MDKSKVVFLDFDGVLNSDAYYAQQGAGSSDDEEFRGFLSAPFAELLGYFDPVAVARLNQVTDATGAVIVLSTSWVAGFPLEGLIELLDSVGVTGAVIGSTPRFKAQRNDQIKQWLQEHEVDRFVIFEDYEPLPSFPDQDIRTCEATGLLDEHVVVAIAKLQEREEPNL